MGILAKLLRRSSNEPPNPATVDTAPAERQVFCSGCFEVVPESKVKVIPLFNEDADRFMTTYRCGDCWIAAMDDTALRLLQTDDENQIASVAEFFEAYGVVLLEHRRGDPAEEVRTLLLQLLAKLRSDDLALAIGQTKPLQGV